MAQGSLPVMTSVLMDLLLDDIVDLEALFAIIDRDALRARLLLPEHYSIEGLRRPAFTSPYEGYIELLVSSPDVPLGAEILPRYELVNDEPRLLSIDIAPQTHTEAVDEH